MTCFKNRRRFPVRQKVRKNLTEKNAVKWKCLPFKDGRQGNNCFGKSLKKWDLAIAHLGSREPLQLWALKRTAQLLHFRLAASKTYYPTPRFALRRRPKSDHRMTYKARKKERTEWPSTKIQPQWLEHGLLNATSKRLILKQPLKDGRITRKWQPFKREGNNPVGISTRALVRTITRQFIVQWTKEKSPVGGGRTTAVH